MPSTISLDLDNMNSKNSLNYKTNLNFKTNDNVVLGYGQALCLQKSTSNALDTFTLNDGYSEDPLQICLFGYGTYKAYEIPV